MSPEKPVSARSYVRINKADLSRLSAIAADDRSQFFDRCPRWKPLYANRIIAVCLCQGAALHFVDRTNGVKDFDVWTFYACHPGEPYPYRRRGKAEFGSLKFGRHPDDLGMNGRRVDLIGRSIPASTSDDPVETIRRYLQTSKTTSAVMLRMKSVVVLDPPHLRGAVIWP